MKSTEDVYGNVKTVLMEALLVDSDEIVPQATLQGGLGAESIDFLDIIFRLEREFGIEIDRDELFPDPISLDHPTFARDGRLTDEGLTALRLRLPYADFRDLELDRRLDRIDDLFTVDLVRSYIGWKLRGRSAATSVAGAPAREQSQEGTRLLAASTGR